MGEHNIIEDEFYKITYEKLTDKIVIYIVNKFADTGRLETVELKYPQEIKCSCCCGTGIIRIISR